MISSIINFLTSIFTGASVLKKNSDDLKTEKQKAQIELSKEELKSGRWYYYWRPAVAYTMLLIIIVTVVSPPLLVLIGKGYMIENMPHGEIVNQAFKIILEMIGAGY